MFRVIDDGSLKHLESTTLTDQKFKECQDLRQWIYNHEVDVFEELDEPSLAIVGAEVMPSPVVADRIDLLAVDRDDGTFVVIELKKGRDKRQLLQAIAYTGMIAKLELDALRDLPKVEKNKLSDALSASPTGDSPRRHRIILIAEEFDYEVLVAAEWLSLHDIGVKCVRVQIAKEASGPDAKVSTFVNFSTVFPPSRIEEEARIRKNNRTLASGGIDTWEGLFKANQTEAAKQVKEWIIKGEENRFSTKSVFFRIKGTRLYEAWLKPTNDYAVVEQQKRFDGDIDFWKAKLNPTRDPEIEPKYDGQRIRFKLYSESDFKAFRNAVHGEIQSKHWTTRTEIPARPSIDLGG